MISCATVDPVGLDALAKFGYSRLNSCRIIRFFGRLDPFTHFFTTGTETTSDAICEMFEGPFDRDKHVKCF